MKTSQKLKKIFIDRAEINFNVYFSYFLEQNVLILYQSNSNT